MIKPATGKASLRQNSFLIVSGSEQFDMVCKRVLADVRYTVADFQKSASAARRCIMERDYDVVIINAPLADEFGHELARDIALRGNASILVAAPSEVSDTIFDHVVNEGILVIGKPLPKARLEKIIRFMIATQNRMRRLEKKVQTVNEKMEENRLVSKAKLLLVERRHMTEDDAHRYIGKLAMDNGVSRRRVAEAILEETED